MSPSRRRLLAVAAIAAVAVLHVAAVRVGTASGPGAAVAAAGEPDLLGAVLGDARVVLGRSLYEKADIAFHMGVTDTARHGHGDCGALHGAATEISGPGAPHDPPHDPGHPGEEDDHDAASWAPGWVEWINSHAHPATHRHLEGTQAREMLPWLALAIRADPHAPEPYLVAAYWLGWVFDRIDEAEGVLRDGIRKAEPVYALERDLGRLYHGVRGRSADAVALFEQSLRSWDAAAAAGDEPDPEERAQTLFYLAACLHDLGRDHDALLHYRELLGIWPDRPGLNEYIRDLEDSVANTDRDG